MRVGMDRGNRWHKREIRIGTAEYPYYYGLDCIPEILQELQALEAGMFIVVTDDTVLRLHGDALLPGLRALGRCEVLSHRPGESAKMASQLVQALETTLKAGATRRTVVVTFGGGVPGNWGGLVAALLFRGVRLVHIPTTTIAAMDSVLSTKQAINSSVGKNHIGTYLAPRAVFTDVRFLMTLPERELLSGLCEAAKNCLTIEPKALPDLHRLLAKGTLNTPEALLWMLDVSIEAKMRVTVCDTREQSTGLILEYGHTVGHALELADYRRRGTEGLSHGASVAFGMVVAAHLSRERGWLSREAVELHETLAAELGAPVRLPSWLSVDEVMDVVRRDNKRGYLPVAADSVAFVLLREIGQPAGSPNMPLVPVPLVEVQAVLSRLRSREAVPQEAAEHR
jgi:3-dehydroquinate synthetase